MVDLQIDDKLIVFESSPDFSDSSRALYDYVIKETDYKAVWIVREQWAAEVLDRIGVSCAVMGSDLANNLINRAHYLVSASFCFAFQKRIGQIHVSAWHAFAIKLVGFFESATADQSALEDLKVTTTQSDLIATTSRSGQLFTSGMFATDPRKCLITGFPRNDYLFIEDGLKNLEDLVGFHYGDSKLLLYLPTMRRGLKPEGDQFEANIFNYEDYDPIAIDSFLQKNDAYLVAKLHFADIDKYSMDDFLLPSRVILLNNEMLVKKAMTIYHVMNAFDVLITDYSSVYVDYLLLNRPIVFSCTDLEKYSKDRGLIVNDPRCIMPGPIVDSQEGLLDALSVSLKGDHYSSKREEAIGLFHEYRDSFSSKRLFEAMIAAGKVDIPDCNKEYSDLYVHKNSPLSQYTGKCIGEFYYDCGNGFNEKDKQIVKYNLNCVDDEGFINLDLNTDVSILGMLRFDPDRTNRVIIQDFRFVINGQELMPTYTNGIWLDDKIFFKDDDPQILFDFTGRHDLGVLSSISVKFRAIDAVYEGATLLAEAQAEKLILQDELDKIYDSKSWKITRLLRLERGK